MKKIVCILVSVLLVASVTLPCDIIVVGDDSSNEMEFMIKSSVRFTASPSQAWNFTEEEKMISLYMNNSWQTVNLINSSYPFENVTTDEDGNAIAILNLPKCEAEKSVEYTAFYQVVSKPRTLPNIDENAALPLSNITDDLKTTYCGNSGTWMTNNADLQNLAETLTADETNVLVIVENFVSWIWGNIEYKSHEVPFYPNETLSSEEGDCDEQAILLISLCRIIGIPAYLQIGCIYNPTQTDPTPSSAWDGHVENVQIRIGWHGWLMVYIPPWGWLPVDLTYSSRLHPLAAIETAAVTSQKVIQYLNIVQLDYVTEARQYRSFLQNNNFHIQVYDEIIPGRGADPFIFLLDSLIKYALVAFLFAGIFAGSVVGFFYIRRTKKKNLENL
jgi:hypothetical protein